MKVMHTSYVHFLEYNIFEEFSSTANCINLLSKQTVAKVVKLDVHWWKEIESILSTFYSTG